MKQAARSPAPRAALSPRAKVVEHGDADADAYFRSPTPKIDAASEWESVSAFRLGRPSSASAIGSRHRGPHRRSASAIGMEFLRPLGLSQATLARHLNVSLVRVNELVKGKRGVSAETAWLLVQTFGTTPQFWINLQSNYDLAKAQPAHSVAKIRRAS